MSLRPPAADYRGTAEQVEQRAILHGREVPFKMQYIRLDGGERKKLPERSQTTSVPLLLAKLPNRPGLSRESDCGQEIRQQAQQSPDPPVIGNLKSDVPDPSQSADAGSPAVARHRHVQSGFG